MGRSKEEKDLLQEAFELAYFIHPDKDRALPIVTHALCRLDVSVRVQNNRRYYPLKGHWLSRRLKVKARSKVSLERYQQLQLLIYLESDSYEKCQEAYHNALTDEDLIIRFIKHLVRITAERSSFYVALGLSRLLYTYTTQETMRIYDFVMQGSERVKDEEYYRKQKGILLHEIQERFGSLLKICRLQKGEKRFQYQSNSAQYAELVTECLNRFTLWGTSCVLPERRDQMKGPISPLHFNDTNPDAEYPIEINRMHTLIHPKCFTQMVIALGLALPAKCLAIPVFFHTNEEPPRGDRRNPPPLQEADFATLRRVRGSQAIRRKSFSDRSLSIIVDGVERARLDTLILCQVQFEVTAQDRLIEVKGFDDEGDLLLASYTLIHHEMRREKSLKYSIVLEGSQELSFLLHPSMDSGGELAGAVVNFTYREAPPARALSRFFQQLHYQGAARFLQWNYSAVIKAALVLSLIIIGVGIYFHFKGQSTRQPIVQDAQTAQPERPSLTDDTKSSIQNIAPSSSEKKPPLKEPKEKKPRSAPRSVISDDSHRPSMLPPLLPERSSEDEGTRSVSPELTSALRSVHRVYVESRGGRSSQHVRNMLTKRIEDSIRLSVANDPQDADAILLWSLNQNRQGKEIEAQLVNIKREMLWSTTQKIPLRVPQSQLSEYAAKVIEQLLKDIEKADGK